MFPSRTMPMHLLLTALGPLCLLLAISYFIWGGDIACYKFWRGWKYLHSYVSETWAFFGSWGNLAASAVYALILVSGIRHKNRQNIRLVVCYIVVQLIIALLLIQILKNGFGVPRPMTGETESHPWTFLSKYQSFPSGHTTEIVGAILPLALWRSKWRDALIGGLWIAIVAYSRVYLCHHYLSDILGGLVLGCLSGWLILHYARRPQQEQQPPSTE